MSQAYLTGEVKIIADGAARGNLSMQRFAQTLLNKYVEFRRKMDSDEAYEHSSSFTSAINQLNVALKIAGLLAPAAPAPAPAAPAAAAPPPLPPPPLAPLAPPTLQTHRGFEPVV